jgi:AbrB family looped-hinge helix DNA binding protein
MANAKSFAPFSTIVIRRFNILELLKENTSRKVDSLGRVSIPKSMRDRLDINEGDEVEFYLLNADNGEQFVCLTNHRPGANKYENAIKVLEELGLDIPEELESKI